MKKLIFSLVFMLVAIALVAQTRVRPRDLTTEGSLDGSEILLVDKANYGSSTLKKMSLTDIVNYTLAQGGSGDITEVNVSSPLTGGGTTGAISIGLGPISESNLNITNTGTVGYFLQYSGANQLTWAEVVGGGSGDITAVTAISPINGGGVAGAVSLGLDPIGESHLNVTNSPSTDYLLGYDGSDRFKWLSSTDYVPWASTTNIQYAQTVDAAVRPYQLPVVRLAGADNNDNGETIDFDGLRLYRITSGTRIEWRISQDFNSLPESIAADVNGYDSYVTIDHQGDSRKILIMELLAVLNSLQYEVVLIPPEVWLPTSSAGVIADAGTVEVEVVVNTGTTQVGTAATDFSYTNGNNITSVSFAKELTGEITATISVPSSTIGSDGSEFFGVDIVYTDSDGIQSSSRYSTWNPVVQGGGGGSWTYDDQSTFNVIVVDDWPSTEEQGFFFKMDEGLRYYYIDKGSCGWGYQLSDGTGDVCLQTK
jgi:hypothetical protein